MNKKNVEIITLGCRVNQYESCAIAEKLKTNGISITKGDAESDYYIVNTCAVTAESERKSRQIVRRCASKGKVLVIGCASQLDNSFSDIENVIFVGGNRSKMSVADVICSDNISTEKSNAVLPMDGAPYEDMCLNGSEDLFSECRAFIKIQDGCNGKCTYCIIPKCRGSVRSRSETEIIEEAKRLVLNGYREIILTGIEVGAYNKIPLSELIVRLSEIDGLMRLRLGSLSPNVISDKFLEALASSSVFMPHIHLSLQSCCDKILRAMRRPYSKKDVFDRVSAIRKKIPNCMISADVIVGFPGESEADFTETVHALDELGIFHVHSFPYSERKGTVAATLTQSVPKAVRAERNSRLISACEITRRRMFDSVIGKKVSVLVEKQVDDYAYGHTEEFFEARFPAENTAIGDIIDIMITTHNTSALEGRVYVMED